MDFLFFAHTLLAGSSHPLIFVHSRNILTKYEHFCYAISSLLSVTSSLVYTNSPLIYVVPVVEQAVFYTNPSYFSNIHFNIILPSVPGSSK
jgi:hypothetical protein